MTLVRDPLAALTQLEVPHLEYLLREVISELEQDRPRVAISNLAHAVWVARTKDDSLSETELRRLVNRVVEAGGEFA